MLHPVRPGFLALALLLGGCASPPPDEDGGVSAPGDGTSGGDGTPVEVDPDDLTWQQANLTTFISYPDEGSEECLEFSGCEYKGQFAAFHGEAKSEDWVMSNNIAAVHSDDFDAYVFKTLRVRADGEEIDVVVYDLCSDSDCDGCCTRNASETGFLIDLESYTAERFGREWGVVEWACLDC